MSKEDLLLKVWSPDWTATCVRCLVQPTMCVTGHVTLGPQRIGAGWCRDCLEEKESTDKRFLRVHASVQELLEDNFVGWCGHWVPAMGRTSEWPG